jgi:hypothetical protein
MHTKDIGQDLILESDSDEAVSSDSESEAEKATVPACDDSIASGSIDKIWSKPQKLEILVVFIQSLALGSKLLRLLVQRSLVRYSSCPQANQMCCLEGHHINNCHAEGSLLFQKNKN